MCVNKISWGNSAKSKSVVKALVIIFTLFGLPKVVQSDQGTNFMSNVFQQVMLELGIQQVKSSAYHAFAPGGNWDEGIRLQYLLDNNLIQPSKSA